MSTKPGRRVAPALIAALCLLSAPSVVHAEAGPTARQRYLAGAQAYAQGKYSEAVDQFLAADHIASSPALSFDIARSYEKLGESSLALRWYRDYLRRAGDPGDGAKVRRIVTGLEHELRDKGVQQVTVRSVPRGATVSLDGEPAGITPWTGDLPPGRHRASLSYDGYERTEKIFVLSPEEAIDVDVRLAHAEPPPAAAAAVAAPAGAPVAAPAAAPAPEPVKPAPELTTLPPEPQKSSSGVRTAGIVTMSVGGAALGGSLAFELLREKAESDAKKDPTQLGYASKRDQANDRLTASRVLLGVGAGLVVTGGVLFFVGKPSSSHTEVAVSCTPANCGATAFGTFQGL